MNSGLQVYLARWRADEECIYTFQLIQGLLNLPINKMLPVELSLIKNKKW
jgi:hypothetical protein